MKTIGTFESVQWGKVQVLVGNYGGPGGPLAVTLATEEEPLATLSVNMYKPECSADSRDLPADCFYVKDWSENELIAEEAAESGLFVPRDDLGHAQSGYAIASVWQLKA